MMNGFLPSPTEWMRVMLDVQKAQIETAGKMIEAGTTALDPARFEQARQSLEDAGQQALEAAENLARAQWEWLNLWRC
jgi:hypothetical protein